MYILGFDIGGTKCAAVTASYNNGEISILNKQSLATNHEIRPEEMINRLIKAADSILLRRPDVIGISCGGPLDAELGIILSPPNLPGWDNVEIVKLIEAHYGVATKLQNDANASALAEWKFGAGVGCKNMIFLTFGTGLGAGLILNGQLYSGACGNAGEVGHIRLAENGPVGFAKNGSFEGFCSGGGIAKLGYIKAMESIERGVDVTYFKEGMTEKDVTAKLIAEAAIKDDPTALEVYRISGKYLGRGLSFLIDILNPEKIVIGSVFARNEALFSSAMKKEIEKETLPSSRAVCQITAAKLGEKIGDYAAIATALI